MCACGCRYIVVGWLLLIVKISKVYLCSLIFYMLLLIFLSRKIVKSYRNIIKLQYIRGTLHVCVCMFICMCALSLCFHSLPLSLSLSLISVPLCTRVSINRRKLTSISWSHDDTSHSLMAMPNSLNICIIQARMTSLTPFLMRKQTLKFD